MNLYAERNAEELEPEFSNNLSAMTKEGLHGKTAIALELAWRDKRLASEYHKGFKEGLEEALATASFYGIERTLEGLKK